MHGREIVISYGMDVRGIVNRFPVEARDLSLFATFDARSAGVLFLGLQRSGPDADRGYEHVGLHFHSTLILSSSICRVSYDHPSDSPYRKALYMEVVQDGIQ
jgi:hypothetical protein